MTYRAGVATSVITPPLGVAMMGFAASDHDAEGIHDDLYVRALWLDGDGGPVVLVSVDLAALDVDEAGMIKAMIHRQCGLRPARVLLSCTHTHAGPLVAKRLYAGGSIDQAYLQRVRKAIVSTVAQAGSTTYPAAISFAIGSSKVAIGRRLPSSDGFKMAPNPDQPINTDTLAVLVRGRDGTPRATLFGVSCHPTVMGPDNYRISAEFPGVACQEIERALAGSSALFVQGACGDVKARRVADLSAGRFRSGTYEDVECVGREVAADILSLIDHSMRPVAGASAARTGTATLPFDLPDDLGGYFETVIGGEYPEYQRRWARHHLRRIREGDGPPTSAECPVQVLAVGDALRLVGFGGELCSQHADHVKAALGPAATYTLGYANGVLGYLPTDKVLREGGYEALESVRGSPSLPAPFGPGIDQRRVDAAVRLSAECS